MKMMSKYNFNVICGGIDDGFENEEVRTIKMINLGKRNPDKLSELEGIKRILTEYSNNIFLKDVDKVMFKCFEKPESNDFYEEKANLTVGVIFDKETIEKVDWKNIEPSEIYRLGKSVHN